MAHTNGSKAARIGVGSRVTFPTPSGTMRAVVIEDRGRIGWKGRRMMRIRPIYFENEQGEAYEMPLDLLTLSE